ncbi:MAG: hypothetical protein WC551_11205 [Patescibacteria group bacterium]
MLCLRQDIKDRLGLNSTDTQHDDVIDQILAGFSARADSHTGRTLTAPAAAVTEYYTGLCHLLHLRRYPIISITSVKESWTNDFTNDVTELVEGTDFRQASGGANGIIQKLYGIFAAAFESVQVVYRGGFAAPDAVLTAGETALPADLREAAIMQCSFVFKRRDDIGLEGVSFDGGSFSKFSAMKLLPEVAAVLDSYKRIVF